MIEFETEDPLVKETQKHGTIDRDSMHKTFLEHDWRGLYEKMQGSESSETFHSPSIYFKDKENHIEICFSLLDISTDFEFLVFFSRQKNVRGFLGFGSKIQRVTSDLSGISAEACQAILSDFINVDLEALEKKFIV